MLEVFVAFSGDWLATLGLPLSGTAAASGGLALQRLLKVRAERARDVLIDELKRGTKRIPDISEDEAAAITFRYFRAATEGAARINLRLLAAVIAGSNEKSGTYADDFLRWADTLASMTREELIVCGVVARLESDNNNADDGQFWQNCKSALKANHGFDEVMAEEVAASAVRTGLLGIEAVWGGNAYHASKRLKTLMTMIDLERAFDIEGVTL